MPPRSPERRAGPPASARIEDETADRRQALALVPVSRETEDRLALYVDRLRQWQRIKNLVGPSTLQHPWTRHIADSAQLHGLAPHAGRWADLGSGAGFPGLVIAILLAGVAGARVDLIESNNRKCAFLRDVVRETGAPAVVHAGRIEAVVPGLAGTVEVVTARALAPLAALLALGGPLLKAGALGLFLTGGGEEPADRAQDMAGAGPAWQVDTAPSKTHGAGRILMVRRKASWDKDA